jgi:hypothetical protein
MATTYVDYTATAAQTDFAFTFPYLEDEHVIVEIDGSATTAFSIVTTPSTKIVLNSGATAGQVVRVRRKSQPDTNLVDFENGSVLTESELDRAYLHNRYLNEEIAELNDASLQKAPGTDDWDAGGSKIINVGTPTLTADATTKDYVDAKVNQASTGSSFPPLKWQFTGTAGANTTYSVTDAEIDGDTAYDVSVDGLVKEPGVDFTVDPDTDTLTIVPTLSGGEDIVIIQRGFGVAISTGSIGEDQLQTDSVSTAKIQDNAVDGTKIADDSISRAKIQNDAVDGTKIADDSIDSEHYVDGSIDSEHINTTDPVFNVQTDGKVGIGTANPAASLEVQGSEQTVALFKSQSTVGGATTNVAIESPSATSNARTRVGADVDDLFFSTSNGAGDPNTSVERMRIDTNGNVGIGTTSPSAPLDVTSTTGGVVFPRLTTAQRDLINGGSPTDGETIFNTTTNQVESWNGSSWVAAGGGATLQAKASFQGVTSVTRNMNAESNIASVTRTSTGQYTVTFTSAVTDPVVSLAIGYLNGTYRDRSAYFLKDNLGNTVYSGSVTSIEIITEDSGNPRDADLIQLLVF